MQPRGGWWMLKNILLPEQLGSYYLFPKRVIGFDIQHEAVSATQIYLKGNSITIERVLHERLEGSAFETTQQQLTINALKRIASKLDKAQEYRCALPSSQVIFKELTFPFLDLEKIKMVLAYEIEPLIPFSLNEAVIDFIVTNQDQTKKQTTVLVAITQPFHIEAYKELFSLADIPLTVVNVDILALYGLYAMVHSQEKQNSLVLSFGYESTTLACLEQGQLKIIRTFAKGIQYCIESLAQQLQISDYQAKELIERFGVEQGTSQETAALHTAFSGITQDLGFTLQSLPALMPSLHTLNNLIIGYVCLPIKELPSFLESKLSLPCSYFDISRLVHKKNVHIAQKASINEQSLMSVAIAFSTNTMPDFNFYTTQETKSERRQFLTQFIVAIALFFAILLALLLHTSRQTGKLQNELNKSKQEVIASLKDTFAITDPSTLRTLPAVLAAAKTKVHEEETLWFAFSKQKRMSLLRYLQELSALINRQEVELNLKKLIITETSISMQGSVPDFKSLAMLEADLAKSTLFKTITRPQEKDFVITITLKTLDEETA